LQLPSSTVQNASIRIVVADDEAHIRLVVGGKFRSEGFTVVEARDGEEALELVRSQMPSLLVTDLQMPYMNGLELCTQLAADLRTASVPALLLTARGHILEADRLSATIIKKVMSKPFSVKSLFEQATMLLAQSGAIGLSKGSISDLRASGAVKGEAA